MIDFEQISDPFAIFASWLASATTSEPNDPTAMSLSSVDSAGFPNIRMVLLKDHGPSGFVFYTNFESVKASELLSSPKAALLFHWKSVRRQVRIRGEVHEVTAAEADAYFATRHPESRLGAWASDQSRPLDSREAMLSSLESYREKFTDGDIPRPPHWSGFRLVPHSIEFWQDGEFRLHDRILFQRIDKNSEDWDRTRLYP